MNNMKKYYAVYKCPASVMANWMKTPEAERKAMEEKMKGEWSEWEAKNKSMIKGSAGLGKTKLVTGAGVSDIHNDLMMYTIVEAETPEAAAEIFKNHPHFQIPEATIEVMESNPLPGMQ